MKNLKHCCLIFTIHFHVSDLFPVFSRGLNLANDSFRDNLSGVNLADDSFRDNLSGVNLADDSFRDNLSGVNLADEKSWIISRGLYFVE